MLHHEYSVLGTGMKDNILNQVKDLDLTSWDFKADGNIMHILYIRRKTSRYNNRSKKFSEFAILL